VSILSIDFETRATVDLRKTGVYPYAEHADTDIWCMAWAFDDEEPAIWRPATMGMPVADALRAHLSGRVVEHILAGNEIRAWNAQFERVIWRAIMVKRYGAPAVRDEQFVCTAAEAAAMALPRSLDQCAKVLGVTQKKDVEGYNLMMRMTRPRSFKPDGTPVWWDTTDKLERLYAYCKQDVRVERANGKCIRRLVPNERAVYLLDQRVNDRGVRVDVELVNAAQAIADEGTERANGAIAEITGGAVETITNHKALTKWLNTEGVETVSVGKPAVAELLESDLAPKVREALEVRAEAGRTSIAKLKRMLEVLCGDGRARGLALYHAASTGRWGGKLLQPQNFPRGEVNNVEQYIPEVLAGRYDFLDLFENPIVVISSLLRAMIVPAEGHEFIAGDFSAIEARVLNWLAGQDDVVGFFERYDAGDKSMDPYKQMAVRMGRAASIDTITKDDRQAGKAAELGCGFGMGAKKFIDAAWKVYQVRVSAEEAKAAVDIYRSSHAAVVDFWYDTEGAVKHAIGKPGAVFPFGALKNLKAVVAGSYLYVVLPSGRPLCYAGASIKDALTPWGEMKPTIHYWGVDPNPLARGEWAQLRTYGGHLVENIVQAVARDLLAEAMLRAETMNYVPVMHVHDEIVTEVPVDFGDVRDFERLMSALPTWATGCPVAAEAWRGERYRK